MPRLSIVIPALDRIDALEQTLVSVLANRPDDCEIVVVLNGEYADPYALAGEVRFIKANHGADAVVSLNVGLEQCSGQIVHVLLPGAEVTEYWVDDVLSRFDDPLVAAVAPVLIDEIGQARILAAGLDYDAGGARLLNGARRDVRESELIRTDVLGPVLTAAFYRRDVIWELLGGFDASVGPEFADVDAALRIKHAGYRAELAVDSHVVGRLEPGATQRSFQRGQRATRLFWRNVPIVGLGRALARRPFVWIGQTFSWNPVAAFASLLGSLAATLESSTYRRHYRHLDALHQRASLTAVSSTASRRIDPAEPAHQISRKRVTQAGEKV